MLKEIQYRTFDDLLDSVRIDLRTFDLEGMIDSQQLLKVAMRVNYDLGLKINPARSKVIEIVNGKGRLPADIDVLNFALLCDDKNILAYPIETTYSYKTYCQGVLDGINMADDVLRANAGMINLYTQTLTIVPGDNLINHNLNTRDFIVQCYDATGNFISLDIVFNTVDTMNSFNLNSLFPGNLANVKVTIIGGSNIAAGCGLAVGDISTCCSDGLVTTRCTATTELNTTGGVTCCNEEGFRYEFKKMIPLRIGKNKTLSVDSPNIHINTTEKYTVVIKNGFLVCNFPDGEVYLNYQSLMEDDEGNLLVMDHPYANEYYEYAIKQRIFENLFMAGEPVNNHLQLVTQQLRPARNNALTFVNTPDFATLKQTWEMNRKAQYLNYYRMFK
jgi:hypothetical protein